MEAPEQSKSARKREAQRILALGRRLTKVGQQQLDTLEISEELRNAIIDYGRMSSHGAQRRQLQFIGKLMRHLDISPILAALSELEGRSASARYATRTLEDWRRRLIDEPKALTEYLLEHPETDRQQLKHLIGKVRKTTDEPHHREAARALFRFLRESSQGEPSQGERSEREPSQGEPSQGEPSKGEPSKGDQQHPAD